MSINGPKEHQFRLQSHPITIVHSYVNLSNDQASTVAN